MSGSVVSVDKLMEFRQRHRDELTAFQEFVAVQTGPDGPLADLSALEDPGALEVHSAINVRLPKDVPVADTLAAIGVGVGTGVAAVINPLFAIATLGLLILRVARDKSREARLAVEAAPAAYLMFAREELTPAKLLDNVGRQARSISLGV